MIKTLLAALITTLPASVWAANCLPTSDAYAMLAEKYGESRAAVGAMPDHGVLVEFWMNPKTGTWTLVATSTDGRSCAIAEGDAAAFTIPVTGDPA